MRRQLRSLFCCSLVIGLTCLPALASAQEVDASEDREAAFEELAREVVILERFGKVLKKANRLVRPTVVHIEARKPPESPGRKAIEEAGSGVIISHRGKFYVLTNRHVILHAPLQQITIKHSDGRRFQPVRVWSDRGTDVAVMRIDEPQLIAARLADSSKVEIGDFVLAVGSPFGLSHSITFGIISAKGRHDLELGAGSVEVQNFLQTDAAINPGNSGGPLLNLRGEVIGINTAIASSSGGNDGIGFSIPINMAVYVAQELVDRGNVARSFLGVLLDAQYGPEDAARLGVSRPFGARIKGVTDASAAQTARLRAGDVILEFDGVRIEDDNHLINRVSITPVGKEIGVRIIREGRPMLVRLKLGSKE